jgi:hypothetical protein
LEKCLLNDDAPLIVQPAAPGLVELIVNSMPAAQAEFNDLREDSDPTASARTRADIDCASAAGAASKAGR